MDVMEFLDGKTYKWRGISGKFVYTPAHVSANGMFYLGRKLEHIPDARGKRTKAYRDLRLELRDDWVSDVSYCDEEFIQAAIELGYTFEEVQTNG